MDSKAIRTIVILGLVGTVMMTLLMMFSLDQVADTKTPQIAADVAREFAPALAPEPPVSVRLTMTRDGKGAASRRVYALRLRPNDAVAAEPRALERLVYHCAELCADEIGEVRGEVVLRCVAELPDGSEKEAIFVVDAKARASGLSPLRSVPEMPPASAPDAETAAAPADR